MKKILLSVVLVNTLMATNLTFSSVTKSSNTVNGVFNKKDLSGKYNAPSSFDKTTSFFGWRNVVRNPNFNNTNYWNVLSGSGFKAEIKNGFNRDNNSYMWSTGPDFEIGQNKRNMSVPYFHYVKFRYMKTGKENKDTSQAFLDVYDSSSNLIETISRPKQTGDAYVWHSYSGYSNSSLSKSNSQQVSKFAPRIQIKNVGGANNDVMLDNFTIKVLPNYFYADDTNIVEKIFYPNISKNVDIFGMNGQNYIVPKDFERWSHYINITTGDIGDYVALSYGKNDSVWGGDGDDTIVGYQGIKLSGNQYLYSYAGDDKLYLPANGSGHKAIGGNGWDTVVLRGNKDDYTFSMNSSGEVDDFDVSSDTMSGRIYECEQICFTTHNPLKESEQSVHPVDMDCYVFKEDGTTDMVNTNLPATIDSKTVSDYVNSSGTKISHTIDINTDIVSDNPIGIYLTNLPVDIISVTNPDGSLTYVNNYTNGDGDERHTIKLYIDSNNTTTFDFNVDNYNNANVDIDMTGVVITRALD